MEKTLIEVPVQIVTTRDEKIEKREFFVVEGLSEVGVFTQWLPAELKEKFEDDVQEYVLVFEPRKEKNKIGFRVVDLVAQ